MCTLKITLFNTLKITESSTIKFIESKIIKITVSNTAKITVPSAENSEIYLAAKSAKGQKGMVLFLLKKNAQYK